MGVITGLYRHSVKGLSADALEAVIVANAHDTFPDDRRFALLLDKNQNKWNEQSPEWLHKENFLCAFTEPQFLSQFEASYQILQSSASSSSPFCHETYGLPCDGVYERKDEDTRRLLTIRDRSTGNVAWGPTDLAKEEGRISLGDFFSEASGRKVHCITADASTNRDRANQKHQFGNTSSGWKQRKDTRTIHIINADTVQQVAEKCQVPLNPTRFRPNMIVEGWEPWSEFDWIGKPLQVKTKTGDIVKLSVLSKTVRCDGVSVDPLDPDTVLDIPKLLARHFPEHGPYLGVYAVIEDPGVLSIGDEILPVTRL